MKPLTKFITVAFLMTAFLTVVLSECKSNAPLPEACTKNIRKRFDIPCKVITTANVTKDVCKILKKCGGDVRLICNKHKRQKKLRCRFKRNRKCGSRKTNLKNM